MALVFRALRRGASRGTGVIALCDRSERAQHAIAAVTCGKPTSCWISSTATERGDLRAACIAGWHPILPMRGRRGGHEGRSCRDIPTRL